MTEVPPPQPPLKLRSRRRSRRRTRGLEEPIVRLPSPALAARPMPTPEPAPEPEVEPEPLPEPKASSEPEPEPVETAPVEVAPDEQPDQASAVTAVTGPVEITLPAETAPAVQAPAPAVQAPAPAEPVVVERARKAPLYWRVLRLRYVHPNGWQRALLLEGVFVIALVLVLAGKASAWTLLALPVVAAIVVKANDLIAGGLQSSPRAGDDVSRRSSQDTKSG